MNISVGTISRGTLRAVDLLHAFACELQRIAGASDLASEALERANAPRPYPRPPYRGRHPLPGAAV